MDYFVPVQGLPGGGSIAFSQIQAELGLTERWPSHGHDVVNTEADALAGSPCCSKSQSESWISRKDLEPSLRSSLGAAWESTFP